MMRGLLMAHDQLQGPKQLSLLRLGVLGAIAGGSVGLVYSIVDRVQYGFSTKLDTWDELTGDACFVLFLATIGMMMGAVVCAALRLRLKRHDELSRK
jgi:hypothetical protein